MAGLAKALTAMAMDPRLPIVLVTVHTQKEERAF